MGWRRLWGFFTEEVVVVIGIMFRGFEEGNRYLRGFLIFFGYRVFLCYRVLEEYILGNVILN